MTSIMLGSCCYILKWGWSDLRSAFQFWKAGEKTVKALKDVSPLAKLQYACCLPATTNFDSGFLSSTWNVSFFIPNHIFVRIEALKGFPSSFASSHLREFTTEDPLSTMTELCFPMTLFINPLTIQCNDDMHRHDLCLCNSILSSGWLWRGGWTW